MSERPDRMSDRLALGVDIGTHSAKGVLCTAQGRVLAEARVDYAPTSPSPGRVEHDALAWWIAFCDISQRLVASLPEGRQIAAVGVGALTPCLIPVDDDAVPLRPAILYRIDGRAARQVAEMTDRMGLDHIVDRCGCPLSNQSLGPKIQWIHDAEPHVYATTAAFLTATSYIVLKLTGELTVDRHVASFYAPFVDISDASWDLSDADGLLDEDRLPTILGCDDLAGSVSHSAAGESGLPAGTPVVVGTADGILEAIAEGVTDPGNAIVNYGSALNLTLFTATRPRSHRFLVASGPWESSFIVSGGVGAAGSLTAWFRQLLGNDPEPSFDELVSQAGLVPVGSRGLLVVPSFNGEETPTYDPQMRGLIAGLTLAHGRGELYRALLEGTAYALRECAEGMRDEGFRYQEIRATGGGTQGRLWPQIVTDVLDYPQGITASSAPAAVGAAFLAALAVGLVAGGNREAWASPPTTIEPSREAADQYGESYDRYRSLRDTNRSLLHALGAESGAGEGRGVTFA